MKQRMFTEAVDRDDIHAVAAMLRDGARLDVLNSADQTVLFNAAGYSSPEMVKLLLRAGADLHHRDVFGQTPLHCAVRYGRPETVAVLLQAGSDTEARNSLGQTPLFYASTPLYLSLLTVCGADPNAADCPASALMGQIGVIEERRISGSS
jgi:ankyrin repeat protein